MHRRLPTAAVDARLDDAIQRVVDDVDVVVERALHRVGAGAAIDDIGRVTNHAALVAEVVVELVAGEGQRAVDDGIQGAVDVDRVLDVRRQQIIARAMREDDRVVAFACIFDDRAALVVVEVIGIVPFAARHHRRGVETAAGGGMGRASRTVEGVVAVIAREIADRVGGIRPGVGIEDAREDQALDVVGQSERHRALDGVVAAVRRFAHGVEVAVDDERVVARGARHRVGGTLLDACRNLRAVPYRAVGELHALDLGVEVAGAAAGHRDRGVEVAGDGDLRRASVERDDEVGTVAQEAG